MRVADKDKMTLALKGASEELKDLFFSNMSERAAKLLREDMEAAGAVRLKDVEEAQQALVQSAKDLADRERYYRRRIWRRSTDILKFNPCEGL